MSDPFAQILTELGEKQLPSGPLKYVLERNLYGNGLVIELGTGHGQTANLICQHLPGGTVLHTFDWFHGRTVDWRPNYPKGDFNRDGVAPDNLPSNAVVHVGLFKDTCPAFAKEHKDQKAALIYVDCDTYQSTLDGLNGLASLIHDGTIIVFDELINYPGYQQNELKAFVDFMSKNKKVHETLGGHGGIVSTQARYRSNWRNQKGAFYVFNKKAAPPAASMSAPVGGLVLQSTQEPLATKELKKEAKAEAKKADPTPRMNESLALIRSGKVNVAPLQIDKRNKRVKLVVTYGRRQYFRALLPYILREWNLFDEVVIWKNTKNAHDIRFLDDIHKALNDKGLGDKFKPTWPDKITGKKDGVFPLYRTCNDANTLYIKIDDDVVWVAPGAFSALVEFALAKESDHAVFSANMVNSGPVDVDHQQAGASASGPVVFDAKNPYKKLLTSEGAKQVHDSLQKAVEAGNVDKYWVDRVFVNSPRWSINCIAFFGNLFNAKDHKKLEEDDEKYISRHLSRRVGRHSAVVGGALMAHYSFEDQRTRRTIRPGSLGKSTFGKETEILGKYVEWAEGLWQ